MPLVLWKWRYNVSNLSPNLLTPPHWGTIRTFGLEFLAVCHPLHRFGDHRYCNSGDVMFLICSSDITWPHVQRVKWIYGWRLPAVIHHLAMFGGDIKYLICHLISQNHLIEHFLKKVHIGKIRNFWNEITEKNFFFLFPTVWILDFCKNMNPRRYISFLVQKSIT